jgi:hypothetical protein
MNAEAFVQEMFKVDPTIRYIAVVSTEYRILVSKQREGVPSLTSEEITRNFVSIVPQIIVEAVDKLSPFLGEVGGITAHYQKALVVFYRIKSLIVVVSFEPELRTPFYDRITETFRKLSAQYLGS